MATDNIIKLNENVLALQKDMAQIGVLVDRLDVTIDKLTEVSTNVSQLLAVHETKLTAQELVTKQTIELLEKRRMETEEKIQVLHSRISSGEKELVEKVEKRYEEILKQLKDMQEETANQHKSLSDRISTLEKWAWIVIGGSLLVGFIINNFSQFIKL